MNTGTLNDSIDEVLPDEARAVIWKILGDGQSPLKSCTTLDAVELILRKHVSSPTEQNLAISVVREWIEPGEERQYIKHDKQQLVAELVFEGIGTDRSERAIWAIGAIDRNVSLEMIRTNWTDEEIESFVATALTELEKACKRDEVLSATGLISRAVDGSHRTKIPRDSLRGEGRLGKFRILSNHGFDLIHRAIHPPIANLIELVVDLRPDHLNILVERLDHPVMQMRASLHVIAKTRRKDHRTPLQWVTKNASDAMVALSILHTLETVNILDRDSNLSERYGGAPYTWGTELATSDLLDKAANDLIKDLVAQLATLDPLRRVKWIGELLSGSNEILTQSGVQQSQRSTQLETYCTEQLAHAFDQVWSSNLLEAFCRRLRNSRRNTWSRHVAELAWHLRDSNPELCTILAKTALDELDRWIDEQLLYCHLYWNWEDWECKKWIATLGAALALTLDATDLFTWVSSRCRNMSLSVWDAEVDDPKAFQSSNQAAQLLLLIALQSIEPLLKHNQDVDGSDVRTVAEAVWDHCHFVGQHIFADWDSSVVAEYAARSVIEFGDPTREWLLNQASNPQVGSRALFGMVDQMVLRKAQRSESTVLENDEFVREFERAASVRFGDGGTFDFKSLQYWGRLWLLFESNELAYRSAIAQRTFPLQLFDRNSRILNLDLLCVGAKSRQLDQETRNLIESTYRDLWPAGFTLDAELEHRRRIDQSLEELGSPQSRI